jgi:acetate kinase
MIVLVLNCGSSSLKFKLIEIGPAGGADGGPAGRRLARGAVERIGGEAECAFFAETGGELRRVLAVPDHGEALRQALTWLSDSGALVAGARIEAVGHRVVHGGERFSAPVLIDDSVLAATDELSELAPLHNPACARGIRAARALLGAALPMVAVFDTAYHRTLPPHAAVYALPHEWTERHGIRRFGFHGIAHEWAARRVAELLALPFERLTAVTLHLGNGCSATATREGRSVDTSMGFTPLEGLVMGTRSGDLDPSLVTYLARREGRAAEEIERTLNHGSGLLGVSGRSNDMRDLLAAGAAGDARAELAVDLFCYRARKYLGAYLAVLGGAQAVAFSGGIGERSPQVRARILEGMEWCGIALDAAANAALVGREGVISAAQSRVAAYVVPSDEEMMIARATARLVAGPAPGEPPPPGSRSGGAPPPG